ncbi:hypothetical protein COLO4_21642 [Corchorus olitorius]|uniref:F-box domain-containing protein n=1 Tax=Corchorus olitorius TaxID=93759 RepID=A0A1R3ISA6_9ROSI|nr:hypothetical protein COLO4_21642 [Corchorus olitorius]
MENANTSPLLLSDDIAYEILRRLPIKSVQRFKLVSEPWNSLISDSKFAESHFHRLQRDAMSSQDKLLLIGQLYAKGGP